MNFKTAPIVLFVYNRPEHTRHTIEALKLNSLADKSDLIIYSDAPKTELHSSSVNLVRDYIANVDGFRSVTIVKRGTNLGLARSIIDGVTTIVKKYGRIIVLEDDMVTSPCFLSYMNDALSKYQDDERVMHISGYMFPVETSNLPEVFFLRVSSCWGWATWARAWVKFEPDSKKLLRDICERKLEHAFDLNDTAGYIEMLSSQAKGNIDSWAVRWYASVFLSNGLCLHPAWSLVSNIGHDGSGVHCEINNSYSVKASSIKLLTNRKLELIESSEGIEALMSFYRLLKPPYHIRIYKKIIRILEVIKEKVIASKRVGV